MKNPSKKAVTDTPSKSRKKEKSETQLPDIEVSYREAADLKTTYVSGVIPSVTIEGLIQISCYTERRPLPHKAVITFEADDNSEEDQYGEEEIIREFNHSFLISPKVAAQFIDALEFGINLVTGRETTQNDDDDKTQE
ncbi:MAG: hypothetical protein EOO61_23160 [Hymenobacter sp.]|nr:MAG: hypothetical protein EOO61_23160 [Hymenobacter sp.]